MKTRNKLIETHKDNHVFNVFIKVKDGDVLVSTIYAKCDYHRECDLPTIDDLHYQLEIPYRAAIKLWREIADWRKGVI